jgi:hypothetical protein
MVIKDGLQGTFNAFARIGKAKPPVAASTVGVRPRICNM